MDSSSKHRFGFVSLIGRANVGKSTLLNKLVGKSISISSNKPQTTRQNIRGILSAPDYQAVFVDTAGICNPKNELQKRMLRQAYNEFYGVDLVLYLVESRPPQNLADNLLDQQIVQKLNPSNTILVINKMDLAREKQLLDSIDYWSKIFLAKEIIPISALKGYKLTRLKELIASYLPEQPPHYPTNWITDSNFSQIAAEFVREQAFRILMQEIPYELVTETEKIEYTNKLIKVFVCIYFAKKKHKKILIGRQGAMLKKIGTRARIKLEYFSKKKIFLSLYVKQAENWQNKPAFLNQVGITK